LFAGVRKKKWVTGIAIVKLNGSLGSLVFEACRNLIDGDNGLVRIREVLQFSNDCPCWRWVLSRLGHDLCVLTAMRVFEGEACPFRL